MALSKLVVVVSLLTYCHAEVITCGQVTTLTPTWDPTTTEPTRERIIRTKTPTMSQKDRGNAETTPAPLPDLTVSLPEACPYHPDFDVILLVDASCSMGRSDCKAQQQMVAHTMLSIKNTSAIDSSGEYIVDRVGYMVFDGNDNVNTVVSLDDDTFNSKPVSETDLSDYFDLITMSDICEGSNQRSDNSSIKKALVQAYAEYKQTKTAYQREEKIVLFQNCKATDIENVCDKANKYIDEENIALNMVIVNNGPQFTEDDPYLNCLVEYDPLRVFTNTAMSWTLFEETDGIRDKLQKEICEPPTPSPTVDPIIDEEYETTADRRRLLGEDTYEGGDFDITSDTMNAPCITMQIKLETENLLPLNSNPDPASNIAIIGKAIANVTGGYLTIPEQPDEEDGETEEEYPFAMDFEVDCDEETVPQMDAYYMENNENWEFDTTPVLVVSDPDSNGFFGAIELAMPDTIIYVYRFTQMPLYIRLQCAPVPSSFIQVKLAIYDNDVLMPGTSVTEIIATLDVDPMRNFAFDDTVTLLPNTTYEVRLQLDSDYPQDCDFSNVFFNPQNGRRRLTEDTNVTGSEETNACSTCLNLAQSPEMKAAAKSMCSSGVDNRATMQTALFERSSSNVAIGKYLMNSGSITFLDSETGAVKFVEENFPSGVVEPCLAIDEEGRKVYAIGGKDSGGNAVDSILGYQVNEDYTAGAEFETGLTLKGPLYNPTCVFWRDAYDDEWLVVVGGMSNPATEFTDKSKWKQQIRKYEIGSDNDYDQGPTLQSGLTNMKPIIMNDYLYLFGGKTHKASKNFVMTLNLNDFSAGTITVEATTLVEAKALPASDQITYNEKDGYMIFGGQTYTNYALDTSDEGATFDLVQIITNGKIETNPTTRRRLSEASKGFTAYDLQKMDEAREKSRLRRRGLLSEEELKSEVHMTEYKYGLDGIWYNFTVKFELCYDGNTELNSAVDYYENVIGAQPNGEDWEAYVNQTSERVLNESLEAYKYWSDGFGAVRVWDLDILSVVYENTPTPTTRMNTHPERRKARFWWTNLGDTNGNDDFEDINWIDEDE